MDNPKLLTKCLTKTHRKLKKFEFSLEKFKESPENKLTEYNDSLGGYLRKHWDIHNPKSQMRRLFCKYDICHEKAVSMILVKAYHRFLNNKKIDFKQMVAKYKKKHKK